MKKNLSKCVVVIGGSGFIGSHTADKLSDAGFHVTIFDAAKSSYHKKNQKFILGNISDEKALDKVLKNNSIVYYFAGISDIAEAKQNPSKTINRNIIDTTKVLDLCVKNKIKRFIYASTMYVHSIYGSFYRATKQSVEIIIKTYSEEYNLKYTLLRYGSLYGSRSQSWNGINSFINQIINENKLSYAGNGEELREYINVEDAAKLSIDILDTKYCNKAITITGQQVIRVSELIDLIFEILGKKKKVKYLSKNKLKDHYGNTPYRFTPQSSIKLVPNEFIDLGQGLYDLIKDKYEIDEKK